jgi:hypothetical protein
MIFFTQPSAVFTPIFFTRRYSKSKELGIYNKNSCILSTAVLKVNTNYYGDCEGIISWLTMQTK